MTIVKSIGHIDHSPQRDEIRVCNDNQHNEGVRSDSQKPELASGPLREGTSNSGVCPSKAHKWSQLSVVRTDQEDTLVESMTEKTRQASPRDEPQRKVSDPEQLVTLCLPTLPKDGTEVTGAHKHHLKKQNKQRIIEKQLGQER